MAGQSRLKDVKDGLTMLAGGRNISSDLNEMIGADLGAKGSGDFLFNLDHPDVSLGLIVVKRDAEVIHEGQDLWFVGFEAIK